jgi:hypothetical protein
MFRTDERRKKERWLNSNIGLLRTYGGGTS